jgi:hypothetical protein
MRRSRSRRRVVRTSLALLAVSAGAAAVLSADGSDEQRAHPRTPLASPHIPAPQRQSSPVASTPPSSAIASPGPAIAPARARQFLTGYLALLHGRGSITALRHVAAGELLRELRRNHPRVTPSQQQSRARILAVAVALRSPASVRAVATVEDGGGPPYALALYLERRGARWVVTRIGDA